MTWQLTFIDTLSLIAFLIALSVLAYTWPRRRKPVVKPFLLLIIGATIWLFSNLIEARFLAESPRLFWNNMQYIGIVLVPVGWFLFALTYAGWTQWLNKQTISVLFVVPILVVILVWTSQWHTIFREFMVLNDSGRFPFWEWQPGPAFWIHTAYAYLLLIGGMAVLVQTYLQTASFYQRQIRVLVAGALIPWLANLLFLLAGGSTVDPTPIAFVVSIAIIAWGIFGFGLVEVVPIAFNQIVAGMKDGVLVLDEQNRIIYLNPAFKQIIGAKTPVTGKPIAEFLDRWPDLDQQFHNTQHVDAEVSFGTKADNTQHYQLSISPLYTNKKQASGRLVLLHEITQIKQTEHRLREARQAAEAANRTKSLFLATMSHELRTPLAAIIGYSELIEEKGTDWDHENIIAKVSRMRQTAVHLNTLISSILDMAQIEAGRIKLSLSPFSLEALIADVIATTAPKVAEKGNTLHTNLTLDADEMFADRHKVRQILLNLLDNAAKFTQQGEITLTVQSVSAVAQQPAFYSFQVSDTGEGIPPEKAESLFKPFVQGDPSHTRKYGGSGLGLAISYSFCQMMGGDMRVASKLGQGTTIWVELPQRVPDGEGVSVQPL